jgi:hypothetical protein
MVIGAKLWVHLVEIYILVGTFQIHILLRNISDDGLESLYKIVWLVG